MIIKIWKVLWNTLFYDISLILSISYNLLIAIILFVAVYSFVYFIFSKFLKKYKIVKYFFLFWIIIRPVILLIIFISILFYHWK